MATKTEPKRTPDARRFRDNLRAEFEGAELYRSLAEAETDEHLANLYRRISRVEARHAEFWRRRLREIGAPVPDYRTSTRVRLLGWLARRFGSDFVLPVVRSMEITAVDDYEGQPEAEEAGLHTDERSHARVFNEMSYSAHPASERIARIEGRHRIGGGNALRAAVMGANDGLVSNLSLVMGVAGAGPGRGFVLLAGLSGLIAGSFSMALGEWISVQSSRELYERQLQIESDELDAVPAEEREELALIYESKGIERETARDMARRIIADRATALETLGREELGIDIRDLGSPWTAGVTSLFLFATAAFLPVLPFFFGSGNVAVAVSALISALALFGLGAAITLFTGREVWFSGTRQMLIGLGAATVTFIIGRLLGAGIGFA